MNMRRLILVSLVVLFVQTGLVILTQWQRPAADLQSGKGLLFKLAAADVNEVLLEDGEGHKLVLKKEQGNWLLPDAGSFPADTGRVQGLIDRLAGTQRGWPEATTAEAATRFKVAADRFERKLSLRKDGTTLATVFLGSSPGLRKTYLRVDGDAEIQTIGIAQHDLEVKVDNWIDTGALRLKPEQVVRIELPALVLERIQDGLQPVGLTSDEEVVKERRDALVKRLTGLTIAAIIGTENKPEYGLDNPALRYSVVLEGGGTIEYAFGTPQKPETDKVDAATQSVVEQSFVLKVSNQKQLFRVDGWQVEEIKNATRAVLVRTKKQETAPVGQPATPPSPEGQQQ
jgi:hypothetical protein